MKARRTATELFEFHIGHALQNFTWAMRVFAGEPCYPSHYRWTFGEAAQLLRSGEESARKALRYAKAARPAHAVVTADAPGPGART